MERRYRKVENEKKEQSVCPSQALEKAEEGPAPAAIDWDAIRKQKDEFAELKWRGESREHISCSGQRFGEGPGLA